MYYVCTKFASPWADVNRCAAAFLSTEFLSVALMNVITIMHASFAVVDLSGKRTEDGHRMSGRTVESFSRTRLVCTVCSSENSSVGHKCSSHFSQFCSFIIPTQTINQCWLGDKNGIQHAKKSRIRNPQRFFGTPHRGLA